jgi:general secretion pathway protein D
VTKTQAVKPAKDQKLSIIANKETNSLIITATPDEMKEIRRIIKELDIVREQVSSKP